MLLSTEYAEFNTVATSIEQLSNVWCLIRHALFRVFWPNLQINIFYSISINWILKLTLEIIIQMLNQRMHCVIHWAAKFGKSFAYHLLFFLYFHLFSATIHSITIETVRSTVLLFDGDAYFCRWLLRLFVSLVCTVWLKTVESVRVIQYLRFGQFGCGTSTVCVWFLLFYFSVAIYLF